MKQMMKKTGSTLVKNTAILFIPLAVYTLYNIYTLHFAPTETENLVAKVEEIQQQQPLLEYITHPGTQGKVILPDSSVVWLNSCPTLKTPAQFDSIGRHIELSGEAYFKVKSNKNWPMYIKANGVTTKVLGTEFNLSAYKNEATVKVTLVEGKVELVQKDSTTISMIPHEQVTIVNKLSGQVSRKRKIYDYESEMGWKEGYLVFNNTPMYDVVRKIERWYGVKFRHIDSQIMKYKFTGRFRDESVTAVLELLSLSSNISYELLNNNITLSQK